MRKSLGLALICVALGGWCRSQDIHFSQFMHAPGYQSPALIGDFNATARLHLNQRTQWRSVSSRPYNTVLLGGALRNVGGSAYHGGLTIYHDRAGDSRLQHLHVSLQVAREFNLSSKSSLSAGVQAGLGNRNVNLNDLAFDAQYNGVFYDPSLGNRETLTATAYSYLASGAGLSYRYMNRRREYLSVSLAAFNLTRPGMSFYNDQPVRLPVRYATSVWGSIPITDKWSIEPAFQLMLQGSYREALPFVTVKREFIAAGPFYQALFAGMGWRAADSGVLMVGAEYNEWRAGISYDLNTSDLTRASNYRGGLELAVLYQFGRREIPLKRYTTCRQAL